MAIEVQKQTTPIPQPKAPEKERFPGKICLLAVAALTGFYYYLIFVVPTPGADDSTVSARAVLVVAQAGEAHPIIMGGVFLAFLVPALAFRASARPYLLRLTVLVALLWAGVFTVSSHPDAQAAEAVRSILSTTREFPETIRGR